MNSNLCRAALGLLIAGALIFGSGNPGAQPPGAGKGRARREAKPGPRAELSVILGRPTDRSIAVSVLSARELEACIEYGTAGAALTHKTQALPAKQGIPVEFELGGLVPNARYEYRLLTRARGAKVFVAGESGGFHTQRAAGSSFTFGVQGDSHPEREGKMYSPKLYAQTLESVVRDGPDFYFMLGDDFSIDQLMNRNERTQAAVSAVYSHQRGFLGIVGSAAALFLVNGNHENAARFLLDGTETSFAVLAGRARTTFYPLPAPDPFYTGDTEKIEHVGLPRDYYAFTWGDALFVAIDPYWHSPVAVDPTDELRRRVGEEKSQAQSVDPRSGNVRGRGRDLWEVSIGDAQYQWLTKTLTKSQARWKFVFAHHVMGTGRGGIEEATLYEWGGKDRRGQYIFREKRPTWPMPIHELFVKSGVTIFFQGHDHIYARQELDGVVYQSCPNPADDTYTAFNRESYRAGVVLPNSGHLRVTVAPERVRVDYVRTFLPGTGDGTTTETVAHSYAIEAQTAKAAEKRTQR